MIKQIFIIIIIILLIFLYDATEISILKYLFLRIVNSNIFIIKILQWISEKPQIISPKIKNLLSLLKDKCICHSFEYTKHVIETNFNENIDKVFQNIDPIPIASGSIAQVYKGLYNNINVAIKIRHPNLNKNSKKYINAIKFLFGIVKRIFQKDIEKIIDINKFYNDIYQQTNLLYEGKNAEIFYKIYKNSSEIVIPKLYFKNKNMLIYEYIESKNFYEYLKNLDKNEQESLYSLIRLFFYKSIYTKKIFHSDFHLSNWGFNNGKLIIYDFGYITKIKDYDTFVKFLNYDLKRDYIVILYLLLKNINNDENNILPIFEIELFDKQKYTNIRQFLDAIYVIIYKYNLQISKEMINLLQIESILADIKADPNLKIKDFISEDGIKYILKNNDNKYVISEYLKRIKFKNNSNLIMKKINDLLQKMVIDATKSRIIFAILNIFRLNNIPDTKIIDFLHYIDINSDEYKEKIINFLNTLDNNFDKLLEFQKKINNELKSNIKLDLDKIFAL